MYIPIYILYIWVSALSRGRSEDMVGMQRKDVSLTNNSLQGHVDLTRHSSPLEMYFGGHEEHPGSWQLGHTYPDTRFSKNQRSWHEIMAKLCLDESRGVGRGTEHAPSDTTSASRLTSWILLIAKSWTYPMPCQAYHIHMRHCRAIISQVCNWCKVMFLSCETKAKYKVWKALTETYTSSQQARLPFSFSTLWGTLEQWNKQFSVGHARSWECTLSSSYFACHL